VIEVRQIGRAVDRNDAVVAVVFWIPGEVWKVP
jgi:hypothetical protein